MKNVDDGAGAIGHAKFDALPDRVQEALGELAGAAREGLLALSVGVGPASCCSRSPPSSPPRPASWR